jgi:hypothetical protein
MCLEPKYIVLLLAPTVQMPVTALYRACNVQLILAGYLVRM